jgi:hypothetical protein
LKKSTLFCGIIGAAVAVVVMTLMTYNTPLAAYAQQEALTLDPNTYFAMDNATAEAYIRDSLGVEQNSTAAALVRENQVMNEETVEWIKEYLVSLIRQNMTSLIVSINNAGGMEVTNSETPPDYLDDEIVIDVGNAVGTPFSEFEGYEFQLGKIIAPNGTQVLPRE